MTIDEIYRAAHSVSPQGTVFMLVDAARSPPIYPRLEAIAAFGRAQSLYQGDIGAGLGHVLPWLVRLDRTPGPAAWFVEAGFGEAWGTFVIADLPFEDARRHLRKFNLVTGPDGASMVFRFFDPRVLRVFLPTCTPAELARFFGPLKGFLAESESGDALLRWSLDAGVMRQVSLPVAVGVR